MYPDSRPHNFETAELQKGLVLAYKDRELVKEGMGFGVPVVRYHDKTLFSKSAEVFLGKSRKGLPIVKKFLMDSVSRKRLWSGPYINDGLYRVFDNAFSRIYRRNPGLRLGFYRLMELRRALGGENPLWESKA